MGAKTISYLELSEAQRRSSAKLARAQIRQQLSTVEAGTDVHQGLMHRLDQLHRWEAGTIVLGAKGKNHDITVVETVPVKLEM